MPSFESLPNVKMLLILFLQKMFKKNVDLMMQPWFYTWT
jgi:hypothetical protein